MSIGGGGPSSILTVEGGVAVWLLNKTGAAAVKGSILKASNTLDSAVTLVDIDDADPIGIMYSEDVPDGQPVLVVVAGVTEVLYSTAVTRATFARVPAAADATATVGKAIAEPLPTSPFATDKHFQEIGHPIESIGSAGLAKTLIHFN